MRKIEIEGIEYHIPESWSEITLLQQIEVERLIQENPDYVQIGLLAGYLKINVDVIKKLHIKVVRKLLEVMDFYKMELSNEPINEFEHGGFKYFTIQSMLKGEFQDFISFEQVREQYKDRHYQSLPASLTLHL